MTSKVTQAIERSVRAAERMVARHDALTALWRFKDGGDIHYVFACNEADAREVFLTETGVEDLTGWELTHLTVDQADAIPVKDEDDHGEIPTTLGAIYRANPERGYVCGTQ